MIDVVTTLFKLRDTLKKGTTVSHSELENTIRNAIVRKVAQKEVDLRQDDEMMAMKSSTLRRNFLEKNMNRQFMPRPSMKYL